MSNIINLKIKITETEWKNNFRNFRELDRYQLFEKGKEGILDKLGKKWLFVLVAIWMHGDS